MIATPLIWAGFIVILLATVGMFGQFLLRRAAPALARIPRVAIVLLVGSILMWPAALLSLGLVSAWVISGPVILPTGASQVCQQCLTSSNPFAVTPVDTLIPSVALIAIPLLAGIISIINIVSEYRTRVQRSRSTATALFDGSVPHTISGHRVSIVPDHRPWALAFPSRHGGIAVSTGALHRLEHEELTAVVAHEAAHLQQRHHIASDLVASIATHMRWIPFIREAAAALPSYLEIAADARACQRAGTPALVRALLVLGDRTMPAGSDTSSGGPLLAAGPERIPHLVRPETSRRGYLPAVAASAQFIILSLVSTVVLASYLGALLSGCI